MRFFVAIAAALAVLPLGALTGAARAQDIDNDAIAAARKAALVFDIRGVAPVKPTTFYFKVDVHVEGTGRAALQARYQRSAGTLRAALEKAGFRIDNAPAPLLLRRVGESSYQGVTTTESEDRPADILRVAGYLSFPAASEEKARAAYSAMRATGVPGDVQLSYGVRDEEAAHRAALKAAVTQAKQRVQVLGEAAKPKVFELVFLKEGDFQMPSVSTNAQLQGGKPLVPQETIEVETTVTFFYGFKPVAAGGTATPKVSAKRSSKPPQR